MESGGYLGMSSAFILKALADEGLTSAKIYSIEWNKDCPHGILIPDELRDQFVPLTGDVRDLVKGDQIPKSIDMFLHDSSHRLQHMLWEFREFWKRLRDGGLLVSHDVHFNAAFPEFIAKTYAHEKHGLLDVDSTGITNGAAGVTSDSQSGNAPKREDSSHPGRIVRGHWHARC